MLNESSLPTRLNYHIPGAAGRGGGVAAIHHISLATNPDSEHHSSELTDGKASSGCIDPLLVDSWDFWNEK